MPQDFDFKLNGESVPVTSGQLLRTMDTAVDRFEVDIVVNRTEQPELYEQIKPFRYTPATVSLDKQLQLTGNLTKPSRSRTKTSTTTKLVGFSKTFNFVDSHIPSRYEFSAQTLHTMATDLAKATATKVVFETDPGGIFLRKSARRGQSAFTFLKPLAQDRSQLMSCTPKGELLFHTANVDGQPVGTIAEGSSLIAEEFKADYDGRKRFKTYKVVSMSPFGPAQAVVSDDNINQPRHRVIDGSDIAGSVQEIAAWQKNLAVVDALTMPVPMTGWNGPDGKLWQPNTLVTIESETMFIPDGFTFLIRSVEFVFFKTTKAAIVSIIPPNAYTKNVIVEPWF